MKREPSESHSRIRPGIRRLLGLDVPQKDVFAAELEDELRLHLELRAEQLQRTGLAPDAAMREARKRYGPVDEVAQNIQRHASKREHHMRRRISLDSLQQDVRFAFRTLSRSKAWTAVAVLTLALGIGANSAVFSIVNDLLLDPLKYPDADGLVVISRVNEKSKVSTMLSMEQVQAFRAARTLDGIEGVGSSQQNLLIDGNPISAHVATVSSTFPKFAGARVVAGRFFNDEEERTRAPLAVLSEHVWRTQFGRSTNAMGKSVRVEDKTYTVIGVLSDDVRISSYKTETVDIWLPHPEKTYLGGPTVARLAKGATLMSAQQELRNLNQAVEKLPSTIGSFLFDIGITRPGKSGQARSSVYMMAGAVSLLLLIACANVAHLLLARGAARERELSIRAALGAGRGRIVRQLVTESLILSMAGCAAGLAVAAVSLRAIVALRPANMDELAHTRIDARVLLATIAVSALTGITFGLIAGLSGQNGRTFEALRSSIATTVDRSRNRLRALLVITENALSVVLLIGAVLLIRSVINLYHIDPGFDATNVYAMSFDLPESRYADGVTRQVYADRLLSEAQRIPGVSLATIASDPPSRTGIMFGNWEVEGKPATNADEPPTMTAMNSVRPEFFDVIGMKLSSGRTFNEASAENFEVIVSPAMARSYWGETSVVGKRIRMKSQPRKGVEPEPWRTVVGVTPNAAMQSLTDKGNTPGIYFPMKVNSPDGHLTLLVRMSNSRPIAADFRKVFLAADRSMSPAEAVSVSDLLLRAITTQRFLMALLTIFAGLAVTLSAIGLYGVITYMVSQSTREIGVRVALGAARADVIRLVMQKGVALSGVGLCIGLIASFWGARVIEASLYDVNRNDPLSYAIGASLLLVIALVACIAPTARALRIDPMLAMRSE